MPNKNKSFGVNLRDMENLFKHRRMPYPKRSAEFIALIAVSCTLFLFMHTKTLNSRLHEMEIKLQPSELSSLGLSGSNAISSGESKHELKGVQGTYQYLKSTGQLERLKSKDLNNTENAEMEIIFFNRVAKSGSETMMDLMDKLGKVNEFLVARNRPKKAQNLVLQEQKQEDLASIISSLEKPVVYVEHVNYINFTEFNLPRPIYINLVRDPVERVISWFNYVRGSWYNVLRHKRFPDLPMKEKDWYNKDFNSCVRNNDPECRYESFAVNDSFGDHRRQSLFFCGHSADCLPFNSPTAIQKAKYIVEKEYAVVGSWEDTNITLAVLEHYIPRFFQGATSLYYLFAEELRNKNRSQYKPYVADDVKDMIRKNFTNEIDFYRFCKQRLYKQFIAIKLEQNKRHLKK